MCRSGVVKFVALGRFETVRQLSRSGRKLVGACFS